MMPADLSSLIDHYQLETDSEGDLVLMSSDGTGTTFRARDTNTNQSVIVRVFSERLLADSSIQKDFVDHAKLLIELDHPSVTRIIDTGQHGDHFFYVLQDPGGQTVDELILESGPLDVARSLKLHLQLSEALLAVRTKPGLLSRVWPRSLMITDGLGSDPKIHLIAQNLIAPADEEEQPEFLAPEILAGHQDSAQALLYSIGATLYYMLTGKSPYPSGSRVETLLEMKSSGLPDMSLLPVASPVTLLRQVLDAEPRNRPKSLMEWDRALQRFIRFTPGETDSIDVRAPREMIEARESTTFVPFRAPSIRAATQPEKKEEEADSDQELEKVKVHTQRLSVELTKRVQKELALTEQLKALEAELEAERDRVRELTTKHKTVASEPDALAQLRAEKSKIDGEWVALQSARRDLERQQHEFLKKTQRFSVSQLKAESEKGRATSEIDSSKELTETQKVRTTPRFFRFGRKAKAETDHEPVIVVEKSPPTPAPPSTKPVTSQPDPAPAGASPGEIKRDTKVVSFKASSAQEPPAPAQPVPVAEKPAATKKPLPDNVATAPQKPLAKTGSPLEERVAVVEQKETPAPSPKPKVAPKEALEMPVPQYQPLPGAWIALALLASVIALGLFLAYRTFFSRQENYLLGRIGEETSAPVVVNIGGDEHAAPFDPLVNQEASAASAGGETDTITVLATDRARPGLATSREALVNDELRVDMKAFNNFLLIQDEEWAELLHGLKVLEGQTEKYSEDELQKVRQELFEDLERKAQLKKDGSLMKDKAFREVYDYVKSLLPEATPVPSQE